MSATTLQSEKADGPSPRLEEADDIHRPRDPSKAAESESNGLFKPLRSIRGSSTSPEAPCNSHLDLEPQAETEQLPGSPVNSFSATARSPAEDARCAQEVVADMAGAEKMCSQCCATKTPMWRNDSNGNKTLCNACGVRLQRQVNKAKQQAAATSEPPTSLIAGKLPRSRTSPAKLSRADLGRSCSQDSLGSFASPLTGNGSRTLTLVHGPEGEPRLAVVPAAKRKQGDAATPPPLELDSKRLCNDSVNWQLERSPSAGIPADLIVPSMPSWRRVPNCIVYLDPGVPGSSLPTGLLQVFQPSGVKAATCTVPLSPHDAYFDSSLQCWVWNSPAGWSLLLATQERLEKFQGLLSSWRLRRACSALPASFSEPSAPMHGLQTSHSGRPSGSGMLPTFAASAEDLAFIESLNEHVQKNVEAQETAEGNCFGAKALNAPLTQQSMERLVNAFDIIARGRPQRLNKSLVVAFCEKTPWCPHRAIGLLVFEHWVNSILPRRAAEASQGRSGASQGASPRLALSRSFSATSPGGGLMSAAFEPSVKADVDGPSTSCQQNASSESSDQTQTLGVLNGDAAVLPDSIAIAKPATQLPLPMPLPQARVSTPPQHSFPPHSVFGSHAGLPGQWAASPVPAMPTLAAPSIDQPPQPPHQEDEWEPLDPQTLAKIADPHQPRLSPGEEHSDQTTSMMDIHCSPPPQGQEEVPPAAERQDATHSDGPPTAFLRARSPSLRRVVSLVETPDMRSQSPGTPTSHTARGPLCKLSKHSSIGQHSYGKPLYTDYGAAAAFIHQDLAAVEHDNGLFFSDMLNFS